MLPIVENQLPADLPDDLKALIQRLRDPAPLDLHALLGIWEARSAEAWMGAPEVYRRLGERILRVGEPLLAHDVIVTGLEHWPDDVRLRQLLGLALARSGAPRHANEILQQLLEEGFGDEETLGLLARTHKDLWALATDPAERHTHLRLAADLYARAHAVTAAGGKPPESHAWTGINAATTRLLLGERERAVALARDVAAFCRRQLENASETVADAYWFLATLGEAALIAGEWSEAEDWYSRATLAVRGRFAQLTTTRRQARILARHLGRDTAFLDRCFPIPRVVAFAGHMIDQPGRPSPRFPSVLEEAVARAIRERLAVLDAGFGYASAACGSDILFLEAMLDRHAEVHVVLPYVTDEFVADSVDIVAGTDWAVRFRRVLERATRVTTATEQRSPGSAVTYDYASMLLEGLATIRAQQLDTPLSLVAVWNGLPGDGPGGTASIAERWRSHGQDVQVIDLAQLLREAGPTATTPPAPAPARRGPLAHEVPAGFAKEIAAMLFADTVGYSRLTEEQIPRFVREFLGTISDLIVGSPEPPLVKNTWGDGLYFVFPSVRAAGRFALDLRDRVAEVKWADRGLPDTLSLRIALHVGPVYRCADPVSGQPNYVGSHASRAARIEPITPPGHVYASQAFVALAAAQRVEDFAWEYVGLVPLPKKYGTLPMYHLRRRS